jgi:hypothetical protein
MAPKKSSSSGCEPAVRPKCEMVVSWYGKRKRKLRSLTVVVPFPVLERFLRGVKSPSPATRQRHRNGRKGKGCKERRELSRDRGSDSVRVQDAGAVDVAELAGCVSGADVCVSGDSVHGDLVGHVVPVHVASVSSGHSQADCGLASSRTVLRPSVLSLPSPRPTRVVGVGRGLVTGHGGTRPELQVFESGACLVPGSESDHEICADGGSHDLGSSESAEGAGAAVAAAVAAAAALAAAASAQAAISAVQDSLGSARRQRKRGKRNAKKFVGSALSRVYGGETWETSGATAAPKPDFPLIDAGTEEADARTKG